MGKNKVTNASKPKDYPAVKRIKCSHREALQVADFGTVIGKTGLSFFHPETSKVSFNDRWFDQRVSHLAPPSWAPGSKGG